VIMDCTAIDTVVREAYDVKDVISHTIQTPGNIPPYRGIQVKGT